MDQHPLRGHIAEPLKPVPDRLAAFRTAGGDKPVSPIVRQVGPGVIFSTLSHHHNPATDPGMTRKRIDGMAHHGFALQHQPGLGDGTAQPAALPGAKKNHHDCRIIHGLLIRCFWDIDHARALIILAFSASFRYLPKK